MYKKMETQTKELIFFKESGLIECEGVFTTDERKIYNFLLFIAKKQYFYKDDEYWEQNGWDGMEKSNNSLNYFELRENKFKITIKELVSYFSGLGGKEINESKAAEQIWNLHKKELKFNIFKKDKLEAWLFATAIPELKPTVSGDIEYSLPSVVFKQLSQVNGVHLPFAKLDLLICLHVKSKFTGILYEVFQDYIKSPKIPKISIEKLKKLFGLKENYTFFNIKRKCLGPAVKEINANPDIPFEVEYSVIRKGQTPESVQFTISQKVNSVYLPDSNKKNKIQEQNQEFTIKSITPSNKNSVLVTENHTLNQIPEQNKEITENNMTDSQAERVPVLPIEEVRKIFSKISFNNLPAAELKKLRERYSYAINFNEINEK